MKSNSLSAVVLVLVLAMAACTPASTSGNGFRAGAARSLTAEEKLALGSIKLEGTAQALDAKTATKLIPLWQLMLQLISSSSTAPEEVTAVMDQITATMTQPQLNTIGAMTLSQADIFTAFQSQQAPAGGSGLPGGFAGPAPSGRSRGGEGGVVFGGGPGGGFGGAGFRGNNESASSNGSQVNQAQAAQARQNAVSISLINQLIKLLQTKVSR